MTKTDPQSDASATAGKPASQQRHLFFGVLAACACLLCWSIAPLLLGSFRDVVDAHANNAVRYAFGALIWSPLLLLLIARGKFDSTLLRRAVVPVVWNCIGQVCFTMAFYYIFPGMITFGLRAQIVTVALMAPFMFPGERVVLRSRVFLVGLAMVLVGVLTMAGIAVAAAEEGFGMIAPQRMAIGIGLSIGAGIGYAGYGLGVRKHLDGVPHTLSFAVVGLATAVAMVVVMLLIGEERGLPLLTIEMSDYGRLLLTGFIGIGISHVLFYMAMARLGVAVATGVIQIQPVLVFGASHFIYGEDFTPMQFAFGVLAIAGAISMVSAQHAVARSDNKVREICAEEDVALQQAECGSERVPQTCTDPEQGPDTASVSKNSL